MQAHFNQHSPAFSLQQKHWHCVKLHHTILAASECLRPSFLAFLFMGLEEHLVQKICIVYTKIIQTGWYLFVKVLGSWPLAWASSQENNSLHIKEALIWVSPMDRAARSRLTYSRGRKSPWRTLAFLTAPQSLSTVRATHEQLLVTNKSSLGLVSWWAGRAQRSTAHTAPTIPPRQGPFLHTPQAGAQAQHKPRSFFFFSPKI